MKHETTPAKITEKILELCNMVVPEATPEYIPVEAQTWSSPMECFPNVQRIVREQRGTQINGWAIWQWANILIEAEAHSVWVNETRFSNIFIKKRVSSYSGGLVLKNFSFLLSMRVF